ncbi:MAG: peptide deformylase [Methylococcales bacterium]|nr:peptide deformylase [Methylococcales bacterium]MBT7410963.1 peptide deformylase [Methylococcales bacterium]
MALLNILQFPDEQLRIKALPVSGVDDSIRQLVDDMLETMYEAPGIGLAATQVNIHQRIVVIDITKEKNHPYCFINPEIIGSAGDEEHEEGCLSVPGFYENVQRAETVTVKALDRQGDEFVLDADGMLAICIQHEIDHLDGKLFVDYLSSLKRLRIKKKLLKIQKSRL